MLYKLNITRFRPIKERNELCSFFSFIRGLDQSTRGEQAAKTGIDMKRSGVWINRVEKRKKLVLTI
jgi:hypothetical protein